ncbi:DUF2635 domain-containing protein [Tardiphaga sp. vice304]|uniref:DUF2635 domain-containing protein n=1 Tax=Tardiphaga sp. vice304 TaxID=2592817 RepID=UPI001162CCD2|nr:DUF2635 domain-containing protein [Tardiphaga sp. vice304]QDM26997.1 DUF2635 domain-containing protein [Tardiphaga sp. vice304]
MPMIHVKPAKGARVRMPERGSTVMPEHGGWVPDVVHYAGLIRTGDVVRSDPPPPLPGTEPDTREAPADAAPTAQLNSPLTPRAAPKEK